jgi:Flp pilus assembly protein TadD
MASNRLEILKDMVAKSPNDSRTRYMLAMELRNTGALEGAVKEFQTLLASDASFGYAYFHCGQILEKLGQMVEARTLYTQGIAAATRSGDEKARSELEGALKALG